MKPLILSFFAVILIYSLFFDQDEKRERDYQFGLDSSMNAFLLPLIKKEQ